MEVKKLTYGILTTIIAVVLVSAVLIPAISSSSTTTVERENEGYLYTMTDQAGDYVYSVDSTTYATLVNGEKIVFNTEDSTDYLSGISSPTFGALFKNTKVSDIDVISGTNSTNWTNTKSVTINVDGAYQYTAYYDGADHNVTGTIDVSKVLFATNGGNYAVYSNGATFSVTAGDTVYFTTGYSTINSAGAMFRVAIVEGVATVEYANKVADGVVTPIDITATCAYDDMSTTNGVTTYTNLTVTITSTSGDVSTFYPSNIVAPRTYKEAAGAVGPEYTLINIIPLLVLVGVMLGAVGLFISRRD